MARLTIPTKATIVAALRSLWQSERPDDDHSKFSDPWLFSKIVGYAWYQLHRTYQRSHRALFPQTTFGIWLDFWLNFVGAPNGLGGFGRIEARGSTGKGVWSITSLGNATLNNDEQCQDDAQQLFKVVDGPYTFTGIETLGISLAAITKGLATNIEAGETLTFVSTPTNLPDSSDTIADMDDGANRETDPEGRARLLSRLRRPSLSGNWVHWKRTIEEAIPGSLDGYVWEKRWNSPFGWGTTDYACLQRGEVGTARLPTAAQKTLVDAAVAALMPSLKQRMSRQLTVSQDVSAIRVLYTLRAGADDSKTADWDAATPRPLVSSYDDGVPSVTADVDLDGVLPIIAAGIDTSGNEYWIDIKGEDVKIQTYTPASDKRLLTLANAFATVTPSGANPIMAGRGLVAAIYAAIFEHVATLGPERGSFAAADSTWVDQLIISRLQTAIDLVDDEILDIEVELPAADVAPTPSTGSTVKLIAPGTVTVYENQS